ncbi:MAG: hypothetical protein ACI883_001367 [Candidatus Azotimanducaceae bacterium]
MLNYAIKITTLWGFFMLTYISALADVFASSALLVSMVFLLKEVRLMRDSLRHSDFVSSVNRSSDNMLRITENDGLLGTIHKVSAYRFKEVRDPAELRAILAEIPPMEKIRYFHFQRNACLNCEVFLESVESGFIDAARFAMAFGWSNVDFEIWTELGLEAGPRSLQHFKNALESQKLAVLKASQMDDIVNLSKAPNSAVPVE